MLIAQAAQHPEKLCWRNTKTRAALDGLHEHSPNGMFFEEGFELCFCFGQFPRGDGKGREVAEFAELFFERIETP